MTIRALATIAAMTAIGMTTLASETAPTAHGDRDSLRWWPRQAAPRALVYCTAPETFEVVTSPGGGRSPAPTHNLAQSLAGLAAQAVNEGRGDELVWIPDRRPTYARWLAATIKRLDLEERGTFDPWQLLARYRDRGLVKGYVLYRFAHTGKTIDEIDQSVNVATVVAGLRQGVLIEEGQQARAEEMGLDLLFDARGKTHQWCFDTFKDQLNRRALATLHPRNSFNRASVISRRCMVAYDTVEPMASIMTWLEPFTPLMGWNTGGEDNFTGQASRAGHFLTASDSAANMPVLSAGVDERTPPRINAFDPAAIDFDADEHVATFLVSDGDNFRWQIGSFWGAKWWGNPDHGATPIGWTMSMGHLAQMCPAAIDAFRESQPAGTGFVEQGGGYFYPDNFAMQRPNRAELLAVHARKVGHYLRATGVRTYSFICMDVDSPEAREAYAIFAREMDGLAGMIALQYYPYDGGDGEVFWFENARGVEIPVVCVKYSIWCDAQWPRGGSPAKIAGLIGDQARAAQAAGHRSYSITSVHCWSAYDPAHATDPDGPCGSYHRHAACSATLVKWCAEQIGPAVKLVTPEELIWRVRYEHDPAATRAAIAALTP